MRASPTVGVISFPGSNGDHDALHAFEQGVGANVRSIDYRETRLDGIDAVVLPGGFSYGDALRAGAIARFAPVMDALRAFAEEGGPVLGICNGFQILCEAHLLPGALLRNRTLRFHCHRTTIRVEREDTVWTAGLEPGAVLTLPVAHGQGAYFLEKPALYDLEMAGCVVARYCIADGAITPSSNANGSVNNIAAVCNPGRNVVGLMPHPERAADPLVGGGDGLGILRAFLTKPALAST